MRQTIQWLRLRKKTTIVHFIYGALSAGFSAAFFPAGFLLMGVFAGDEAWDDWCNGTREGEMDWWEAFLVFTVLIGVALVLHFCGIWTIRWWI